MRVRIPCDPAYPVGYAITGCINSQWFSISITILGSKSRISLVLVNSIPTYCAPMPSVAPLSSAGSVRIISGAASLSNCVMTGPGRRSLGVSWSESVFWMLTFPNRVNRCHHQFSKSTCFRNWNQLSLTLLRHYFHPKQQMMGQMGEFHGQVQQTNPLQGIASRVAMR